MQDESIDQWTVNNVLLWLDTILLPSLKENFASHHIDGPKLLALSSAELERELGVTSGIIRKKLVREIEHLRTASNSATSNWQVSSVSNMQGTVYILSGHQLFHQLKSINQKSASCGFQIGHCTSCWSGNLLIDVIYGVS
jgi:hypothetical protein